jgi:hypothetical protein
MYYNRTISDELAGLLEEGGKLRWLFEFVRSREDLDFQIGKNKSHECVSVYRGLSRIITVSLRRDSKLKFDAAQKYKTMMPELYGIKEPDVVVEDKIIKLIEQIKNDRSLARHYDSRKEGYYQNEFSRKYGILSNPDSSFVILDKEAVIGYDSQADKDRLFGTIRDKYKHLQREISLLNAKLYGKDLEKKAIGNELDFLALDKDGNLLLIEFKHGSSTSGIYLSPLQIGLYYEIFSGFQRKELEASVYSMLDQKQKIGLIHPGWKAPARINKLIPVLVISQYNIKSSAKDRFTEILKIATLRWGKDLLANLQIYNYYNNGLRTW